MKTPDARPEEPLGPVGMGERRQALLEGMFETMEEGVSVFDAQGRLMLINRRCQELLRFDAASCIPGTSLAAFPHGGGASCGECAPRDVDTVMSEPVVNRSAPHSAELERPDGTVIAIRGRHLPCGGLVMVYVDVTERRAAEKRIRYLATHDGLTGLPNRSWFSELLNMALLTARRHDRQLAVLFLDLDRFKVINDTLGHEAGDELVNLVAQRLAKTLRASDIVARLGGDEFVVLLQDLSGPEQAATVANKLLAAVMQPLTVRGSPCRVTASIGVCLFPGDAHDEHSLMKNADIAMYMAKEEGKNNFQFYSPSRNSQLLERMTMETHLRAALARGEFSLQYQPKLHLQTDRITGLEALLRWDSAELGAVSPVRFIPVAEQAGLICAIGRWVLQTVCAQSAEWRRQGMPGMGVAVNLSALQLAQDSLLDDIAGALASSGMDPTLLELEITEGMVMHDVERAVETLAAIKRMGVRIAIDDFGTGYSSLAQLKRLPIDSLKVDRSFIRDIPGDAQDRVIADAIIAMAKKLGLTVVAEGVETLEQQRYLRERGCDEMQGYYFSRPATADDVLRFCRDHAAGRSAEKDA